MRRAEQPPSPRPTPVGLRCEQQTGARDQDRHAEAVRLEVRERVDRLREVVQEVIEVHPDVGDREQAEVALPLEELGERREGIAALRWASRTGSGCTRRRRRSKEARRARGRSTVARPWFGQCWRCTSLPLDQRPRRPAPELDDGLRLEHQGVERDGEGERSARQERRTSEQTDQPGPLPAPQLDEAGERQDRGDEMSGVPDTAAGGHPQDLRREAEQDRQPKSIDQTRDADPPEQHPAQADAARGEQGVDPGLDLVGADRAKDRDDRHQRDRRERRERHVEPTVHDDHVVRAGLEPEPRAAVEECVGQVEEVATAGVVAAGSRSQ